MGSTSHGVLNKLVVLQSFGGPNNIQLPNLTCLFITGAVVVVVVVVFILVHILTVLKLHCLKPLRLRLGAGNGGLFS